MSVWSKPKDCALCGLTGGGTKLVLVHWFEAPRGMGYEHAATCPDRAVCRARVKAAGKPWPIYDTRDDDGAIQGPDPYTVGLTEQSP